MKIRGYRIEVAEIELALLDLAATKEAIVVAREDRQGDKQLVAYVVPHQEQTPTISELRSFLKGRLPEYMVPSAFVLLDELPLTPNGKLDRRALPAPDHMRPELEEAFVAPRTPVEEVVAGIWANVLGLEQVGTHDNFFELGGHSLSATQVVSRLQEAFQVELSLRALFEGPTIRELTASMASHMNSGNDAIPRLPRTGAAQGFPLSLAQQRVWFIQQLDPGSGTYNIASALRLRGALDVSALRKA